MKKILLFTDCLGAGGAQRQLVGLAVMLQQKGYQVKVCYYQDISFYYAYLYQHQVEHELIVGAEHHQKRILAVAKYFKKEEPDWVIAYQETPSLVACVAKILTGGYQLTVSERSHTQRIGKKERIRFFLYHLADAIVPNSYSQSDFMVNHYPWMKKKLIPINNFVDLEKYHPLEKKRRDVPVIVVAASVWPPKNAIGFIEAVKILKDRNIQFKIEWYGLVNPTPQVDAPYVEECQQKIFELGLSNLLELRPKTQQIAEKYRSADYFCLPSFFEGTPNVICEAMASGLPVICSNVCDNPRYVHEGVNGFLFDPERPEEMADKIEAALRLDDNDYQHYCRKSRMIAEEMLSEDSFINKYLNIINSL